MYLHIGQNEIVPDRRVIGIFDLDKCSYSKRTREYLAAAEQEGVVLDISGGSPKSAERRHAAEAGRKHGVGFLTALPARFLSHPIYGNFQSGVLIVCNRVRARRNGPEMAPARLFLPWNELGIS